MINRTIFYPLLTTLCLGLLLGMVPNSLKAQCTATITNGSMTGSIGFPPAGWSDNSVGSTSDIIMQNASATSSVTSSPDGGNFLQFSAYGVGSFSEATTSITGLTVGDTYTVFWYGAVEPFFFSATNTTAAYTVSVNGTSQSYNTVGPAWQTESYTFVATGTSATLSINLPAISSKDKMLIDGVTVTCGGTPSGGCTAAISPGADISTGAGSVDPASGSYLNTVVISPAGSFGLLFDSYDTNEDAIITYALNGLTVGDSYTVSWFGAVEPFLSGAQNNTADYQVSVNGVSLTYNTSGPVWESESYAFVATSTTSSVTITLPGNVGIGNKTKMLIDGVSITCDTPPCPLQLPTISKN